MRCTNNRQAETARALLIALFLGLCVRGASAQSGGAGADPEAADVAPDVVSELPKSVQVRLRDRQASRVLEADVLLSTARRYPLDVQLLARMAGLGYVDMDTFLVPSARVGATLLIVQFQSKTDDTRAEALALFRALEGEVLATRSEFVGIKAGVFGLNSGPDRYDWLFWHTPQNNWVVIKTTPRDYFEAKLENARRPAGTGPDNVVDHEAIANFLVRLAHIDFAEGEQDAGAALMRQALEHIDAAPPDSPPPALLQLDVIRTLAFAAAGDQDEAQLAQYIRRYASIAAKSGAQLDNVPVRTVSPVGQWESFLDSEVTLEFDVLTDGRTANTVVLSSSSSASFTAAARQATERWRFFPAVANGQVIVSKRKWRLKTYANNARTQRER